MRRKKQKGYWSSETLNNEEELMGEAGYKELIAWEKADELAYQVYELTKNFPKEEIYGITSQLRRAALSVPTNIVEGYARGGKPELKRFLNISLSSLAEVEYLLGFSFKLSYLNKKEYEKVQYLRQETGNILWKFYKSIK